MEYLSLYKKYVMGNPSDCQKLFEERFNSENSFHFDFKIGKHEAFLYNHPVISMKLCNIYILNSKVENALKSLPIVAQKHFVKRSLIDEVQFSNEIEGVVSTRKEIKDIINSLNKNKPVNKKRLEGIVNSYLKLSNKESISLNTSSDIRNIYDELLLHEIKLENVKNVPDGIIFRSGMVEVDDASGESVHNGVYPESEIITYMDSALNILRNADIDPIIRACIFHYLFGYIHPFYDGNGRTSRFITSFLLSKVLAPITGFRISMTIKEMLSSYYKAFKETNDPRNYGDIGTFVNAMLDIIIKSQNEIIFYANEMRQKIEISMNKIKSLKDYAPKELNALFVLLQASLFSSEGISMIELKNALKQDFKTIKGYIDNNESIILLNKSGKEYLYSINIEKI